MLINNTAHVKVQYLQEYQKEYISVPKHTYTFGMHVAT